MTDRRAPGLIAPALASLLLTGVVVSGCERRPYPEPSMAEPPPASTAPELMGAPEDRNGRPLPPSSEDYGQPSELQPAPALPGEGETPPPALENGPPPPPPVISMAPIPNPPERPGRYARAPRDFNPGSDLPPNRVIAMAPIPNPPEPESRIRTHRRADQAWEAAPRSQSHPGASHHRRARYAQTSRAAPHARVHARMGEGATANLPVTAARAHAHAKVAPARRTAPPTATAKAGAHTGADAAKSSPHQTKPAAVAQAARPGPAHHDKATAEPRKVVPVKPVQVAKAPIPALKPAVPSLRAPLKPEVATAPLHKKDRHGRSVTGRTPSAALTAEESARLSALAGSLGSVIASRASLHGADALKAGTPGDVTLTVPQDFADGLKSEAQRNGLADEAASTALTARLFGDGYAVSPADVQSQPLIAGKPTDFRWTVTRLDAAKGPLQAEVGADLLGGGKQHIDLGLLTAKPPSGLRVSPRAVGAGLLVLLVLIVGAIMAGGRRRTVAPSETVRVRDEARDGPPPDTRL